MILTSTQIAAKIGVTAYTIKRWYEFYRDLSEEEIADLHNNHNMPLLPSYETIEYNKRKDKVWNELDIEPLAQFRDWVPPTRQGIFKKYKNKKEN